MKPERSPKCTWAQVHGNEKSEIGGLINAHLEREEIPTVDQDIIRWRVSNALRDMIRT
jgi:hypothetical protein